MCFGKERSKFGRRAKRLYLNKKSCTAMFLAAALVFTSVDGIQVRAEEDYAGWQPGSSEPDKNRKPEKSHKTDEDIQTVTVVQESSPQTITIRADSARMQLRKNAA